ncbi:MAG: ribonuclease H-like domain-containing protein [Candidatus Nanohaloarchaea archaeon]
MRIENSFILAPGVGEKTEKKLWKKGVTHWDHVTGTSSISSRKQEKISSFVDKARRNLEVENSVFFQEKLPNKSLWRLYRNFEDKACFFDIETTGLDRKKNKVTTVSFHRGGESRTLIQGQDLTRKRLEEEMFESKILVSFNGKRFDQPFLEHNFDMDINVPHIDLMYLFKRLGYSGGLKKIEKQLDVERELEDIDGREAVRLWKKYEKDGDEEALDKLVRYNQYDARNLQDLLEIAHQRLTGKVFEAHAKGR